MIDYLSNLYGNSDFQLNLIAESHGVLVEVVLVSIIVTKIISLRENRKWRPARLNVAKEIFEMHKMLFNSAHCVINPKYTVDLGAHGFPPNFTQADANFWGKSQAVPYLKPALDRLRKTVEYNNSALDSTLLPLVSDFLIASEKLFETTIFLLEAYNPKNRNPYHTIAPIDQIKKMEEVYEKLGKIFPELKKIKSVNREPLSAKELEELFDLADKEYSRINLIHPK